MTNQSTPRAISPAPSSNLLDPRTVAQNLDRIIAMPYRLLPKEVLPPVLQPDSPSYVIPSTEKVWETVDEGWRRAGQLTGWTSSTADKHQHSSANTEIGTRRAITRDRIPNFVESSDAWASRLPLPAHSDDEVLMVSTAVASDDLSNYFEQPTSATGVMSPSRSIHDCMPGTTHEAISSAAGQCVFPQAKKNGEPTDEQISSERTGDHVDGLQKDRGTLTNRISPLSKTSGNPHPAPNTFNARPNLHRRSLSDPTESAVAQSPQTSQTPLQSESTARYTVSQPTIWSGTFFPTPARAVASVGSNIRSLLPGPLRTAASAWASTSIGLGLVPPWIAPFVEAIGGGEEDLHVMGTVEGLASTGGGEGNRKVAIISQYVPDMEWVRAHRGRTSLAFAMAIACMFAIILGCLIMIVGLMGIVGVWIVLL
ncbi:hypothetical protein HDU93_008992 [Gonapodya sp. JEL0774]|nr:hypothetical protein HDU93_008992 [Gonapodya sp. JEL0774]